MPTIMCLPHVRVPAAADALFFGPPQLRGLQSGTHSQQGHQSAPSVICTRSEARCSKKLKRQFLASSLAIKHAVSQMQGIISSPTHSQTRPLVSSESGPFTRLFSPQIARKRTMKEVPNAPGSSSSPGGSELLSSSGSTAAGGAAPGSWATQWTALSKQMQASMQRMVGQWQEASKSWKPPDLSKGLGLKVDVDMINPTITGLKQQWQQLPEPVRQVVPFAGVALAAGVGVQRLYQEQLSLAHGRYGHLRSDHEELQAHVKQLEGQLEDINLRRSGAYLEIQLTEAIAKAATAAASAAAAAAAAASACVPAQQQQQPKLPARREAAAAPHAHQDGLPGGQQWQWQWEGDQQVPLPLSAAGGILFPKIDMPAGGEAALMATAHAEALAAGSSGGNRRGVLGFKLPRLPALCKRFGGGGGGGEAAWHEQE